MKLGYVVANDHEEYLAGCSGVDGSVDSPLVYVWTKDPSLAVIGSKLMVRELVRMMRYLEPLWVLQLFETERHFFVGSSDESCPAWLS